MLKRLACILLLGLVFFHVNGQCEFEQPDWNWENSEAYNYTAFVIGAGEINPVSPFISPDGHINAIVDAGDYTYDKGWRLIRRVFGCPGQEIQGRPYFILYNIYTGLLRLYQLNLSEEYTAGIKTATIYNDTPIKGSLLNSANNILDAEDRYPASAEDDLPIYYHERSNRNFWLVSEVSIGFDTKIESEISRLRFLVDVLDEAKIKIFGEQSLNGEITLPIGFQLAGNTNSGNSDFKEFTANGSKALKTTENIFKEIKGFGDKKANPENGFIDKLKFKISDSFKSGGVLDEISKGVGFFSVGFKILSNISDFVSGTTKKDQDAVAVQQTLPITLRGDINLSGSITSVRNAFSATIQMPGSQKLGNANLPYLDCPLGVSTLLETPKIDVTSYFPLVNRQTNEQVFGCIEFLSYTLSSDLKFAYNTAFGAKPNKIEVALQLQLDTLQGFYTEFFPRVLGPVSLIQDNIQFYEVNCFGSGFETFINPLHNYFTNGLYLYNGYNEQEEKHIISTKFIDIENSKGLSISIPTVLLNGLEPHEVLRGLKIKTTYDVGNVTEVFQTQTFKVSSNGDVISTTDDLRLADFELPQQQVESEVIPTDNIVITNEIITEKKNLTAINSILAFDNVDINTQNNGAQVTWIGVEGITLKPGVKIRKGNDLILTNKINGPVKDYSNSNEVIAIFDGCESNNLIRRNIDLFNNELTIEESEVMNVYPNPGSSNQAITLAKKKLFMAPDRESESYDISVYDISGKLVFKQKNIDSGQSFVLNNNFYFVPGTYHVVMSNDLFKEVKKILITP